VFDGIPLFQKKDQWYGLVGTHGQNYTIFNFQCPTLAITFSAK